jgi:hypothetical protein
MRVEASQAAGAMLKVLERASGNVAFWHPGMSSSSAYTHVFEPAAIVRTPSSSLISLPSRRTAPVAHAVRSVDLANGLPPIADAIDADDLLLHVTWAGAVVGDARIAHRGAVVSPLWIADAIAQQLTVEVLDARLGVGEHVCRALLTADLARDILSRVPLGARRPTPSPVKRPAAAA